MSTGLGVQVGRRLHLHLICGATIEKQGANMRTSTSVRIDTEAKLIASEVLKQYGMSLSEGINLFCKQVAMTHSIPFELKVPSERMKKALDELEKREGKSFKSMEALREDLLS
jgi:DNA-damage-inducible protein J